MSAKCIYCRRAGDAECMGCRVRVCWLHAFSTVFASHAELIKGEYCRTCRDEFLRLNP